MYLSLKMFARPKSQCQEPQLILKFFSIYHHNHFKLQQQNLVLLQQNLFSKWINEIFLPHLHFLRQNHNYQGRTVLILDGYLPQKLSFEQIDLHGEKIIYSLSCPTQ